MLSWIRPILLLIKSKFWLLMELSFHMSLRRYGSESPGVDFTVNTSLGSQDVSQTSTSDVKLTNDAASLDDFNLIL